MESDKSLDHRVRRVSQGNNYLIQRIWVSRKDAKTAKKNLGLGLLETRNQKLETPAEGWPGERKNVEQSG